METTLSEILRIALAFVFLGVLAWTLKVIRRHYEIDERPIRLSLVMRRLGIGTRTAGKLQYEHHMPTAVRLCHNCKSKAECDAWLATETEAVTPPAFCPNASFLHLVAIQRKQAA